MTLKTASVLAFERKLNPSDALFFGCNWKDREKPGDWQPITIREKSVRGTISNRLKSHEQDPAKLDAKIDSPNLQTVDVATLPQDRDTLVVQFSLRVLGDVGAPSACNNSEYQKKLVQTVKGFAESPGFNEIARRFAHNLANGRFLWRNRVGAEQVEVKVGHQVGGEAKAQWKFDSLSLSIRAFDPTEETRPMLDELTRLIVDGLKGSRSVLLDITAFARIGPGQEVFPSQELILDRSSGSKSKTLYEIGGLAGVHSQKIGNAIRTIDTWYPNVGELGPIAIEPYGSVTTQGKAYRQPKEKADFYTLLDDWILKDKVPTVENQHYVVAVIIRGGVFGEKAEKGEKGEKG